MSLLLRKRGAALGAWVLLGLALLVRAAHGPRWAAALLAIMAAAIFLARLTHRVLLRQLRRRMGG
ncbi:hypothetical protein OMW55_03280 [Sphingomonas sp. BN140010]|uniref:Uncharacterized protein n=1 Tax=Sphingomonas arvum TaxID=2992113 RepID=A0ABT3JCN0_9SPHN|nr:hypothetical protein [Sphingomonas sp. BN140010]MCW3796828.1 hypothetical protein [Sphingomonas sp. BN140010]